MSFYEESVRKAFAKKLKSLPQQMTLSMTYDRGKEMAEHKLFTEETKMQVYYCDPHSPWQRGTNEKTNMLIRDFFLKQTDFSKFTKKEIKHVQKLLNERQEKHWTGILRKKDLMNYCCVKKLNLPSPKMNKTY
jgi:IS30 family transposase